MGAILGELFGERVVFDEQLADLAESFVDDVHGGGARRASRAELGVHPEARGPRLRERAGALVEGAGTRGDARAGGARLRAEVRELLLDGVQLASRGIPAAASRLGRG